MFLSVFVTLFAASSVAAQDQFWWSYAPENTTGSYEPLLEICGSSCGDCEEDAQSCYASDYSNICYEPQRGETCCQDRYGTSCLAGHYCAYNDEDIAFCCVEGEENEEDCAKALNVTFKDSDAKPSPTTTATAIFHPSVTASDQSIVHRPERTHLPLIPGTSKGEGDPEDLEVEKDVSMAVKIGAGVGGFVGGAILVTLLVIFVLHRRKVSSYAKLEKMQPAGNMHVKHAHPTPQSTMPPMMPAAPSAYEPMRGQHHQAPHAPWAASPAHSRDSSPHLYPAATYTDHPAYSPGHSPAYSPAHSAVHSPAHSAVHSPAHSPAQIPALSQHQSIELTHIPPLHSPDAHSQNQPR